MRVRTETLAKVGLLGLVLHCGVLIGRRGDAPTVVYLPPPLPTPEPRTVETTGTRSQSLHPAPAPLPALNDPLPRPNTPQFDRRIRAMGLDPAEVRKFARMQKAEEDH